MGNRAVVAVDALTPPPHLRQMLSADTPVNNLWKKAAILCGRQTGAGAPVRTVVDASFNNTLLHDFLFFFLLIMTFKHKSCDKRCFEIGLYFRYEMIASSPFFNRFFSSPSSLLEDFYSSILTHFFFLKKAR